MFFSTCLYRCKDFSCLDRTASMRRFSKSTRKHSANAARAVIRMSPSLTTWPRQAQRELRGARRARSPRRAHRQRVAAARALTLRCNRRAALTVDSKKARRRKVLFLNSYFFLKHVVIKAFLHNTFPQKTFSRPMNQSWVHRPIAGATWLAAQDMPFGRPRRHPCDVPRGDRV